MTKIRVRARAVDMLGRQQIAGIPTSLHELFKNAHDAYADHAEIDFFRTEGSLLLRDDGVGMTKNDFESRWLTLGTESKMAFPQGISAPYKDPAKPLRPIMGEKGIGRLAIAAIGRQVLIMTRAERDGKLDTLVACFIHWGLFELPGIDLSDIDIPVEEWRFEGLPTADFIQDLVNRVKNNINRLKGMISEDEFKKIYNDLSSFKIAPDSFYDKLKGLTLSNHRGTHFFIHPVDPILESDIDERGDNGFAPPLKKNLIGFCNTMIPDAPVPAVTIAFRDHRLDGSIYDLIDQEEEFFTPADFKCADHHFDGIFDEYGQFSGFLSIYGGKPIKYVLSWNGAKGCLTQCGTFRLKMAYVQGLQSESRLPPEVYGPITMKLDEIGGIYVYRDGIRILPYGNSDYDWLNIERRRSKAAKDAFFSYRRTFGVVEISKKNNANLIEKAGREGFMENTAFRQMSGIIQNFLVEVVKDYFRKSGDQSEDFWRVKDELQKQHELLQKREARLRNRKNKFMSDIDRFFNDMRDGKAVRRIDNIRDNYKIKIENIISHSTSDPKRGAEELLKCENQIREEISRLCSIYTISRPRGIGLTKNQSENWNAYLSAYGEFEEVHIIPLDKELRKIISEKMSIFAGEIDRRRQIGNALQDVKKQSEQKVKQIQNETNIEIQELNTRIVADVKNHISTLQNIIQTTFSKFERTDVSNMSEIEILEFQKNLEGELESAANEKAEALASIRDQLGILSDAIINNESIADVTSALEDKSELLEDQVNTYAEMAQIGTAVGIVQHEFSSTFSLMRSYIRQLRGWAEVNPQLGEIYTHIRNNFQHLDEYMNVFKPFNRRLHRTKVNIPGQEIRYYLKRLFGERLDRHGVTLKGTQSFDNVKICAYPSTIYPCFVNLVDNSIYWLTKDADGMSKVTKGNREIVLDTCKDGVSIRDTGPGVDRRIEHRIFDFGYSRKKNGRGMGLYISRTILRNDGFDLVLCRNGSSGKTFFKIIFPTNDSEDKNNE